MAKRNLKITLADEASVIAIKQYAKDRGTSVSALVSNFMRESIERWESEESPNTGVIPILAGKTDRNK